MALRPMFVLAVLSSGASADQSALCSLAADRAAQQTGVPSNLLQAMTLVETRHRGSAWPWTVNIDGQGTWHPTRSDAEEVARAAVAEGKAVDIGCFQINTRWHAGAFPSVDAMFEPDDNAIYAARYLLELHKKTGNWADSIAAYHSRDPDRGRDYLTRVGTVLASMETDAPGAARSRRNDYPLLMSGASASNGSLVPRLAGGTPILGAP